MASEDGHINEKGLVELQKQNLLEGDKMEGLEFCHHCILGKYHRFKFGTGHVSNSPFEYVYVDLWVQQEIRLVVEGLIYSPS